MACLGQSGQEPGHAAIVGGQACDGDVASSVLMVAGNGGTGDLVGSAVLIAPDVALTDRHVVTEPVSPMPPSQSSPRLCGADGLPVEGAVAWQLVPDRPLYVYERAGQPPVARVTEVIASNDPYNCVGDVAVLLLDRRLEGRVVRVPRARPAMAGDPVIVAGFGHGEHGSYAPACRQRRAVVTADSRGLNRDGQGPTEFVTSQAGCRGDSGGPVLDLEGRLVGLVERASREHDPQCAGPTIHVDLSFWSTFVTDALARATRRTLVPAPLPGRDAEGNAFEFMLAAAWSCRGGCARWRTIEPVAPVDRWVVPGAGERARQRHRDVRTQADVGLVLGVPNGAVLVTPDFERAWLELGGPAGCLGWPYESTTSPDDAPEWVVEFDRGVLVADGAGGAQLRSGCGN